MSVPLATSKIDPDDNLMNLSNQHSWGKEEIKMEARSSRHPDEDPRDISTACVESFRRIDSAGDISLFGEEAFLDDPTNSLLDDLTMEDIMAYNSAEEDDDLDASKGFENPHHPVEVEKNFPPQESLKAKQRTSHKEKINRAPKRPLSAYNLFFKAWRVKLLATRGSIGFADLGRQVGQKWKSLTSQERSYFEAFARRDSRRYRREMDEYRKAQQSFPYGYLAVKTENSPASPKLRTPCIVTKRRDSTCSLTSSCSNETGSTGSISTSQISEESSNTPRKNSSTQQWQLSPLPPPALPSHGWTAASTTQGSLPLPVIQEHPCKDNLPIPPGSIVTLPDQYGYPQRFRVDYTVYSMPMAQAKAYVGQWANHNKHRQDAREVTTDSSTHFIQPKPSPSP